MQLEHDTWVVVADGEKYLLLCNHGDTEFLDLRVVRKRETDNPPARELASDRPGRQIDRQDRAPGSMHAKSAMEETDWHRIAEQRFARDLADTLCRWVAQGRIGRMVVAADPRTLGELRAAWDDRLSGVLLAEIAKDLTNVPVDGIEAAIRDI